MFKALISWLSFNRCIYKHCFPLVSDQNSCVLRRIEPYLCHSVLALFKWETTFLAILFSRNFMSGVFFRVAISQPGNHSNTKRWAVFGEKSNLALKRTRELWKDQPLIPRELLRKGTYTCIQNILCQIYELYKHHTIV